jgi:hypothetical protein
LQGGLTRQPKPEGNRPLGRPRRRWENGIRMDLGEIGLVGVAWIRLAQDRDRLSLGVKGLTLARLHLLSDKVAEGCVTRFPHLHQTSQLIGD